MDNSSRVRKYDDNWTRFLHGEAVDQLCEIGSEPLAREVDWAGMDIVHPASNEEFSTDTSFRGSIHDIAWERARREKEERERNGSSSP
jgi:hypothetical protein